MDHLTKQGKAKLEREVAECDRKAFAAHGIVWENNGYYVKHTSDGYTVYKPNGTHAVSLGTTYANTEDGKSLAIASAKYESGRTKPPAPRTSSHTPGTFTQVRTYGSAGGFAGTHVTAEIAGKDFETVAQVRSLIASAPALLAACKALLQHCVSPGGMPDKGKGRTQQQQDAFDAARSAIASAESH